VTAPQPQSHNHDGEHRHESGHDHDHDHDHDHGGGVLGTIKGWLHIVDHTHSHGAQELIADPAFMNNRKAIRTVWIALGLLGLTTLAQVVIYLLRNDTQISPVFEADDFPGSRPLLLNFKSRRPSAAAWRCWPTRCTIWATRSTRCRC
jgi:membrane-associated PAP2 superfamily phosphatase